MRQILIMVFIFMSSINMYSQGEDIVFGKKYNIASSVLNEQRQIAVFTPEDYQTSNERYQVLYVLDGEWNFHFVSSLVDKLVSSGDIPKMIVIGIANNNRSKDLTPAGANDNKDRFGGGELFLDFLTEELQPWVEGNFRTHPYKVLAGHSFGGLFTIYSMMRNPGTFQSYIALSPSLGRNNEQQVSIAKDFFKSENIFPQNLFLAVGNEGGLTYYSSKKFMEVLKTEVNGNFRYKFEILKDENHVSITTQGFINGLKFIHDGFNPERVEGLDDIFLIESHFQSLSKKFGYEIKIPEEFYQKFVKEQIAERELDYALFILEKYQKDYVDSPSLLLYFADVFLLKGNFEEAKAYYLKLKELGIENQYIKNILNQMKN
ncbi:alpha/beta hydrolase [Flagellimonas sp. 2504JD1-5]